MAILSKADLNFQNALAVIPATQSFILPIPAFETDELSEQQPVLKGSTKSGDNKGVVFLNAKDKSWQQVRSDGEGVVVINDVSPAQSKALLKKVMQLSNNQPENLDKDKIKLFLKFTHALGLKDVFQADKNFVETKMNMIEVWDSGVENLGFHKYQDKKEVLAVRFSGIVSFEDPSFSKHTYENGCVVVKNEDNKIQVVKPDVFLKSYTKPNGSPVTLFDIPMKLTSAQYKGMLEGRGNIA